MHMWGTHTKCDSCRFIKSNKLRCAEHTNSVAQIKRNHIQRSIRTRRIMDEKKFYICPNHRIKYRRWRDYVEHQEKECETWLKRRNVCTFFKDGRACGAHFKQTASLILHFFKIHDLYACTNCFSTFKFSRDLENHVHSEDLNVRLRK